MNSDEKTSMTTIQKMENLAKINIFSRLAPSELLLLSEAASEVTFQQGELIYKEGDDANEIYSLIAGRVDLFRGGELVNSVVPGDSFGTLGVLSHQKRISSAIAIDASHCLKIKGETFWEMLEEYTPVCHRVIEVLVQQIETLTARVAGMETETASVPHP